MIQDEKDRLTREDIETIAEILQDYIETHGHTVRESEYPAIFRKISTSMLTDDGIVTDGDVTDYVHG